VIELWIVAFSLILARVGTFVTILPLIGGQNVPRIVKAGLAFSLAVPLFLTYGTVPSAELVARFKDAGWLTYGLALGQEAILGAGLGYAFGLFLVPFRVAGEFIGQEMGLSTANQFDPTSNLPANPLTELFETFGSILFLGMDGHHVFIVALYSTFTRCPIGGLPMLPSMPNMVDGAASTQEAGVLLAIPVVLCLFLTTIVVALMARAAPHMNLFSIGFTLRVCAGLVAVFILMPELLTVMTAVLGYVGQTVTALLNGFV